MQTTPPSLPHSGMGIASFIISLVAGLGLLVTFGIAGVADSTQPGGLDEESVMAGVLGLLIGFIITPSKKKEDKANES